MYYTLYRLEKLIKESPWFWIIEFYPWFQPNRIFKCDKSYLVYISSWFDGCLNLTCDIILYSVFRLNAYQNCYCEGIDV